MGIPILGQLFRYCHVNRNRQAYHAKGLLACVDADLPKPIITDANFKTIYATSDVC